MMDFANPYAVLFGIMMLLFGVAVCLAAALKRFPLLSWPLTGVLGTLAFLFLGLLALDLTRVYAVDLRPAAIDARWVLYPAAVLLLGTGTLVLGVYGDHAGAEHAWEYRQAVRVCVALAFVAFVGIALQPLFT